MEDTHTLKYKSFIMNSFLVIDKKKIKTASLNKGTLMKNINLLFILFLGLVLGFHSCNTDETCRKSRTVLLGMNFYLDTINQLNNRLVVLNLSVDSVWVKGVGNDSVLYNNRKRVNSVKLPLNSFSEESKFHFQFNTFTDTIAIKHKNINEFLSLECGYIRTFEIDTVISTHNFIDSISVTQELVNTIYVENIQIHHNK